MISQFELRQLKIMYVRLDLVWVLLGNDPGGVGAGPLARRFFRDVLVNLPRYISAFNILRIAKVYLN